MGFESAAGGSSIPVLCVHGIWDNARAFDRLRAHLEKSGIGRVEALDLAPNDGSVGIAELARQVGVRASALVTETGSSRIDLVGFSMGALVSRAFLADSSPRVSVRRFISISGPHAGSWTAYLSRLPGARDMRPSSELLRQLPLDARALGVERAHSFRTPFDLMVFPSSSARLSGAEERVFPVPLHAWMLRDARVLRAVVDALKAP